MNFKILYKMLLLLTIIPFFVSCSSKKVPVSDLSIAKMAVLEATEVGDDDEAKHLLAKAKDELSTAQKMLKNKDYVKAQQMAQKATADARLAKIKAQNAQLQTTVNTLDLELKKIKKDFITIDEDGQ